MKVLITNDDGIQSFFLKVLVDAFVQSDATVSVAAPKGEKSWIGRAFSRNTPVSVEKSPLFSFPAWAIDGTPSDCVNIALGHLLPEKPDIVISGINLGFNGGIPFILSSGTIAAAIEGAMWKIPSMALSLQLPVGIYDTIRNSIGHDLDDKTHESLKSAARHSVKIAREFLKIKTDGVSVMNINFPVMTRDDTEIIDTEPAKFQLGSLFKQDANGLYRFHFSQKETPIPLDKGSDMAAIFGDKISRCVLDFSRI